MIPYTQTTEDCLTEMFHRIGRIYPTRLTKRDDWYMWGTWTEDEENDFRDWMRKLLKKRYRWPKKKLDWEVDMFLLLWGWDIETSTTF